MRIALVGVGHTHAHVLAKWRRSRLSGAELTCVSPYPIAAYSGMLPGVLAGQFERAAMEIDLATLCAAAGVRLIVATASGLDLAGRRVLLEGREPLPYDVVSLGVGSVPSYEGVRIDEAAALVAVKPMQTFIERLSSTIAASRPQRRPRHVAVVGGGAAGVELALCAPRFIAAVTGDTDTKYLLVTGGAILEGSRTPTAARARAALARRGVTVREMTGVVAVGADHLAFDDGTSAAVDVAIWVTAAVAAPFLRATGLPVDVRGFLRTTQTLQSVENVHVFAVGDSGSIDGLDVAKAGVHAVRQGPVLWNNLQRILEGRPLVPYAPQHAFLKLLNTGDGSAIGEWRSWSFEGRLAGVLKTWIDTRFVERFPRQR